MAHVFCLDAATDHFTNYVHEFRQTLVFSGFASNWPQHSLQYLVSGSVVQPDINTALTNNSVDYISAAGHGQNETFTGFQESPIWAASQDLSLLAGTIVHLLSCQAGDGLAQAMIRGGVLAFWGYTGKFKFSYEASRSRDFSADPFARVFLEMDCIIDQGILRGDDGDQIFDSVTQYFNQTLDQLEEFDQVLLYNNYDNLIGPMMGYGSIAAKLG